MIFDQIDLITFEIEHETVHNLSLNRSFWAKIEYFVKLWCSKRTNLYLSTRVHIDSPNDGALGSLIQKLYDFYSRKWAKNVLKMR